MPRRPHRRVRAGIGALALLALGTGAAVALGQEGGASPAGASTTLSQSTTVTQSTSTTVVVSNGTTQSSSSSTASTTTTPASTTATPTVRRPAAFAAAGRTLQVTRGGSVVAGTLRCPAVATACPLVTASLTSGGTSLGRVTGVPKPGRQATLRIRLGAAARHRVRDAGTLAAALAVARGAGTAPIRRSVVLRAPRG
jgi:cytoskeletal protein RodZ